jgi:hypothetical protein
LALNPKTKWQDRVKVLQRLRERGRGLSERLLCQILNNRPVKRSGAGRRKQTYKPLKPELELAVTEMLEELQSAAFDKKLLEGKK